MQATGVNRSELARKAGVDRSTVAQLLAEDATRLPNAHLAAACAETLDVSTDWLLGLTDRRERPGDVIAAAVSTPLAERTSADDQLIAWHEEAAGYKVRHVPATLPDVLKTEDVLRWEYDRYLGKSPEQAISAMKERHEWMRDQRSDYEIALSVGELRAFASGCGYYEELSKPARAAQLDRLANAARDLFPALRVFLFDARRVYSAPVTVFGPILAVVYVGHCYLAFRSKERVRLLTEHFDNLVREAEVDARHFPDWIEDLLKTV